MKKVIAYFVTLILITLPIGVLADGDISVSSNSIIVEEGSSQTVTITANNVIGDIDILSDNPEVAITDINEWSTGIVEENQEVNGNITITGKTVGSATIILKYYDVVTFDEEVLSGQEQKITVEVIAKQGEDSNPDLEKKYGNIEIVIRDAESNTLPNAIINVFDENNQFVFSDITNSEGRLNISNVPYGKYYLILKEVPENYNIDDSKNYFTISSDNHIVDIKLNIKNTSVEVPSTGKNSNSFWIIIFGMVIIVSGIILVKKSQRKFNDKSKSM